MRKVEFETFRQETRERRKKLGLTFLQSPGNRIMRTRPRLPIEQDMLLRLSLKRKEEALQSGEYEIISPRRWRIHGGDTEETTE